MRKICFSIEESVVYSNRDRRTLLDKLAEMLLALKIPNPGLLVADAYYASAKIILPLIRAGWHLIAGVRFNAVAYHLPEPHVPGRRGRRRIYGEKVRLRDCYGQDDAFIEALSPVYGETNITLRYRVLDLLWRPVGIVVRFVLVAHPTRGRKILMSTDLSLAPLTILEPVAARLRRVRRGRQVWRGYGSWLRTLRIGVPPSERVVALALRNALPQFLADSAKTAILAKFIRARIDLGRAEGLKLAS